MDPLNYISEEQIEVLIRLREFFVRKEVEYALIGAMGLFLQGIILPRATKDLDFILAVDLPDLRNLAEHMKQEGFSSTKIEHRFRCNNIYIDLLPLTDNERIYWKDEREMKTVGFKEAFLHRIDIPLKNDKNLGIPVIPVPGIIAIKIFAYNEIEEPLGKEKQFNDIIFSMKVYKEEGEERFKVFDLGYDDFETGGAFLIGREITDIFSKKYLKLLLEIIESIEKKNLKEKDKLLFKALREGIKCQTIS